MRPKPEDASTPAPAARNHDAAAPVEPRNPDDVDDGEVPEKHIQRWIGEGGSWLHVD